MVNVSDFIRRAAQRSGFKREFFLEKNMPTQPSNVVAIPFYGNLWSAYIFSVFILKPYVEANKDKYFVLCSWSGMREMFPCVQEYWVLEDEHATKTLATEANTFYNASNLAAEITRGLSESMNIVSSRDIREFYENGFTRKYREMFGGAKRFLPEIPSVSRGMSDFKLQLDRKSGVKIVVYPSVKMRSWQMGKVVQMPVAKEFWTALIQRLIDEGYVPVVCKDWFTYDMSAEFTDRCVYLPFRGIGDVLSALRHVGRVLDIHSGFSRMASLARCPYLSVTERQIYIDGKDCEIDDLGPEMVRQYIFSFSTMLMGGSVDDWNTSLLDCLMARLKNMEFGALPSPNESYESVSFDRVRERKARRMGSVFLKISKER